MTTNELLKMWEAGTPIPFDSVEGCNEIMTRALYVLLAVENFHHEQIDDE